MKLHSRWSLPLAAALGTLVLASPKALPASGGGPIGEKYCPNVPNSTGQSGVISAYGSVRIVRNDVTLTVSQLPPAQFGYFLVSRTEGFFIPPCACAFICLAGDLGRYNGDVGQGPSFSLQIDLNNLPTAFPGSQQTLPGETLHFQAWHRDVGNWNSFTDALKIAFH